MSEYSAERLEAVCARKLLLLLRVNEDLERFREDVAKLLRCREILM